VISSAKEAIEYATIFLEVTRPMGELFYIVSDVEDIRFLPKLTEGDSLRADVFKKEYAPIITHPKAEEGNTGYNVTLFAVSERDLLQFSMDIDLAGNIELEVSKMEEDLPVVYSS
jgi:hypothetical protein